MSFRDSPVTKLLHLMELQKQLRWFELDYLGLENLDPLRMEVDELIDKISKNERIVE